MLEQILKNKQIEIREHKLEISYEDLLATNLSRQDRKKLDLTSPGIISEYKRKSPSKGEFKREHNLLETIRSYEQAGAKALSVLTDKEFFGGSLQDLSLARANSTLPILRKDFIIDPYQIAEARAYGADLVLLIARCLSKNQLQELCATAKELKMQILLEVHSKSELVEALEYKADFVGINCRDLDTGKTDTELFKTITIPHEVTLIAESGLSLPQELSDLVALGYKGFLIGSTFLEAENTFDICKEFVLACKHDK